MKSAKKRQHVKRARRLVKGLILEWADPDPLSGSPHIERANVSHTSPVLRMQSMRIWSDPQFKDWIVKRQHLLWRVTITGVFKYPNGTEQHESRMAIAKAPLWELAKACEPTIEEVLRYGDNVLETRFRVECLGDRAATEEDFDDYEVAS